VGDHVSDERAIPPGFGFHSHAIAAGLRPLVYRIGGFEDPGAAICHRELPLVGTPLILTFGAPYELSTADDPDQPVAVRPAFVAGLHHRYTTSRSTGPNWSIQIDLSPIGAFRILGFPLHELTNRIEDVRDVLGPDARQLISDLEISERWEARFELVEAFLCRRLERGQAETPGITWAWWQLAASNGVLPIAGLSDELGWSRRHFIHTFRRELGLPPKTVARQLRFGWAARQVQRNPGRSLADIAIGCGFADQAHLSREFRELAGITPTELRRERRPLDTVPEG
jgi:AraC-like DNA-binding protein